MPKKIKIDNSASQRFQTTLDGQTVTIELRWMDVSESWFISLIATSGEYILKNRRMTTNFSIFENLYTDFQGTLIPEAITIPPVPLSRNPWETTHRLKYYAANETYS